MNTFARSILQGVLNDIHQESAVLAQRVKLGTLPAEKGAKAKALAKLDEYREQAADLEAAMSQGTAL